MRKVIILLLCFSEYTLFSQNLVGHWQINTPLLKNFEACYYFNDDGTFSYHPDNYNSLQVITALKGRYKIFADSICFTITEIEVKSSDLTSIKVRRDKQHPKERYWVKDGFDNVDGIQRDFHSTSNGWSLSFFNRETIQIQPQEYVVPFEFFEDEERHLILDDHMFNYKYIRIDGDSFYYVYGPSDLED